MKYSIYQLFHGTDGYDKYAFRDYEFACEHGFSLKDYHCVASGMIKCDSVQDCLDELFAFYNMNVPEDFKGHSLSVSDVVFVDGFAWYCDSVGWALIEGVKN